MCEATLLTFFTLTFLDKAMARRAVCTFSSIGPRSESTRWMPRWHRSKPRLARSAPSSAKTEQLLAELKKRREEFQAKAKTNAQASGAALQVKQVQLETQWEGFEAQVKAYFEAAGKQVEQQQATFGAAAAAQTKAWREAADQLQAEATRSPRRTHRHRCRDQADESTGRGGQGAIAETEAGGR